MSLSCLSKTFLQNIFLPLKISWNSTFVANQSHLKNALLQWKCRIRFLNLCYFLTWFYVRWCYSCNVCTTLQSMWHDPDDSSTAQGEFSPLKAKREPCFRVYQTYYIFYQKFEVFFSTCLYIWTFLTILESIWMGKCY